MSGNFAIKGGGVGRLMANAILNFHFDFLNPSLIPNAEKHKKITKTTKASKNRVPQMKKKTKTYKIVSLFASIYEESTIFYPIFRLACYKAFLNYIP